MPTPETITVAEYERRYASLIDSGIVDDLGVFPLADDSMPVVEAVAVDDRGHRFQTHVDVANRRLIFTPIT